MIKKQAIEEVAHPNPRFYNRLFLVPKQGGTWCLVLDVSKLN